MADSGWIHGKWVANVTVYAIHTREGDLVSNINAETRPTPEEARKLKGTIHEIEDNAKIVLENGTVVYGCQVWWKVDDSQN